MREINANLFAAELLIPDDNILESIGYYDYQHALDEAKSVHTNWSPKELQYHVCIEFQYTHENYAITPESLAIQNSCDIHLIQHKFKALLERGYELPIQPDLRSDFLIL